MNFLLFGLTCLTLFLFGVLVMANVIAIRYGDSSACYPLYRVRDKLVSAVVFDGAARDEPWLQSTYHNVNAILQGTSLLTGPANWGVAAQSGRLLGEAYCGTGRSSFMPLPATPPPEQMQPILADLRNALDFLSRTHFGWAIHVSAKKRAQIRKKRDDARKLKAMLCAA